MAARRRSPGEVRESREPSALGELLLFFFAVPVLTAASGLYWFLAAPAALLIAGWVPVEASADPTLAARRKVAVSVLGVILAFVLVLGLAAPGQFLVLRVFRFVDDPRVDLLAPVVSACGVALGLLALGVAGTLWARMRRFDRLRIAPIGEVRPGLQRVAGRVRFVTRSKDERTWESWTGFENRELAVPPGVVFHYALTRNKSGKQGARVLSRCFTLDDGTGRILVDPAGATLWIRGSSFVLPYLGQVLLPGEVDYEGNRADIRLATGQEVELVGVVEPAEKERSAPYIIRAVPEGAEPRAFGSQGMGKLVEACRHLFLGWGGRFFFMLYDFEGRRAASKIMRGVRTMGITAAVLLVASGWDLVQTFFPEEPPILETDPGRSR